MKSKFKISKARFIFIIAYIMLLLCSFYQTTTFKAIFDINLLYNICRLFAAALILFKCVCFDKYTLKELLLIVLLIFIGFISYFLSKRGELLDVILLIVGSANLNVRSIIKAYIIIATSFLLVAFICSQTGIIVDYTTIRAAGSIGKLNIERHGFGIVYATDFAAHILFIYISYFYLKFRRRKIKLLDCLITILLLVFLDIFCDARLTEYMIALSFILFVIAYSPKLATKVLNCALFSKVVVYAIPVCAIFTIVLTFFYNSSNALWVTFDRYFLSNRLKISNRIMKKNGIPFLGQHIVMQGNGFKVNGFDQEVGITYLDSSYIQLLLLYGVFSTILIILIYTIYAKEVVQERNLIVEMIIIILAISSIVNQYLISIAYNPFIIMAGTYALRWLHNKKHRQYRYRKNYLTVEGITYK